VEEDDLVLERAGREEDLLDLATPRGLGLVAENAAPGQVRALALEAGAAVEQSARVCMRPFRDVEVVEAARGHDRLHRAEGVDRLPGTRVEGDRRVDEEAAVREPHERHARAGLDPEEAQPPRLHPEIGGDRFQHSCLASGRARARPDQQRTVSSSPPS
jgi:hypothetical protein